MKRKNATVGTEVILKKTADLNLVALGEDEFKRLLGMRGVIVDNDVNCGNPHEKIKVALGERKETWNFSLDMLKIANKGEKK